jgi:hypothetical protein
VIVPETPERFLVEFLPAVVADLGASPPSARAGRSSAGAPTRAPSESAGVAVRVVDVGQWTLRLSEHALRVAAGVADDVALQVSLRGADFTPLVVEPVRRALASLRDDGARQLWARRMWTRLGRFDQETADLLRRQTGRILLRVDDAGTPRHVALTPGLVPYSLDTAECSIDCDLGALYSLQEQGKSPLDLFGAGEIRISGDAQIALAMAGLFL